VSRSGSQEKPFVIPKQLVWEAYKRVRANKGAPGADGQSLEAFEPDLRNNLYKIWNRMSSGTYFAPPVRAVEIPKPHGGGVRILGVPTVSATWRQVCCSRAHSRSPYGSAGVYGRNRVNGRPAATSATTGPATS
jgi:hypothetical protein